MQWLKQMRVNCLAGTLDILDRIAERLAALRGRADSTPAHLAVGLEGEDAAYFYLERKGYTVVARRWSAGNIPGDVDLIAWSESPNGSLLCFIEVKTRSARDATPAEAAVDRHKRATLRRLASSYIRQLPQEMPPQARFDVISVYLGSDSDGRKNDLVHFESAFGWSEQRERGSL